MTTFKANSSSMLKRLEPYMRTDMNYLASGGFWVNLNFISSSLFAFILSVALAHYVPKETYGVYQYILSLAAIFTAFSLTGINSAITQSVARGYEGSLVGTLIPQLKWNLLSSGASFITAGYYAYQSSYVLSVSLVIVGVFLPVMNTTNTYIAFYTGKKEFRKSFKYNNIFNLLYTITIITTIFYTQNPIIIILNYFIANSLISTFLFIRTLKLSKPNNLIDDDTLPYAKHLSLMNIIGVVANKIDSVLVFHFLGATTLALYVFAKIIPEKIGGAFKSLASIAFPKFSEKESHEIHTHILYKTTLFTGLAVLASIIYIIIAPFVFRTFFPNYVESIIYSQVLSLTLIGAAASLPNYALMAQKMKKELYIINTVNPIIQLCILTSMLYFWGIWGLVYSKIISAVIYLLISTFYAHTKTKPVI